MPLHFLLTMFIFLTLCWETVFDNFLFGVVFFLCPYVYVFFVFGRRSYFREGEAVSDFMFVVRGSGDGRGGEA